MGLLPPLRVHQIGWKHHYVQGVLPGAAHVSLTWSSWRSNTVGLIHELHFLVFPISTQINYGLPVDDNQPLLIHRPKPKEQRMRDLQGLKGEILLIPQLCHLTGLGTMRQVR